MISFAYHAIEMLRSAGPRAANVINTVKLATMKRKEVMEPKVLAEIKHHASRAAKEPDILMNRLTIANAIHSRLPETPL